YETPKRGTTDSISVPHLASGAGPMKTRHNGVISLLEGSGLGRLLELGEENRARSGSPGRWR
ncbi:MAG: hypothetical protein WBV06_20580, partial [Acidimicrobiia bacterium]